VEYSLKAFWGEGRDWWKLKTWSETSQRLMGEQAGRRHTEHFGRAVGRDRGDNKEMTAKLKRRLERRADTIG
jgi:hypothetical protein